jgi:hypothetical protein
MLIERTDIKGKAVHTWFIKHHAMKMKGGEEAQLHTFLITRRVLPHLRIELCLLSYQIYIHAIKKSYCSS